MDQNSGGLQNSLKLILNKLAKYWVMKIFSLTIQIPMFTPKLYKANI